MFGGMLVYGPCNLKTLQRVCIQSMRQKLCLIIIIIIIIINNVLIKVTLSCQRHCRDTVQN